MRSCRATGGRLAFIRYAALLGLLAALLATPAAARITYAGGPGDSEATAIVIVGAKGETDGVRSEYAWLRKHRPGAEFIQQALTNHGKRSFDVLTIRYKGRTENIFFDITDFFGKL